MKKQLKSQRNPLIDIIRALCIIFVVLGHCGFPYTKEIYSFHVPLFFMVSGMTEKLLNVSDCITFKDYFFRKIKRLYVPVVFFSIVEVLFHNFLINTHVYITKELSENLLVAFHYVDLYSNKEIALRILKSFVFTGGSQLGGALWFFRALFFISIIFKIECLLLKNKTKYRLHLLTAINFFLFILGWFVSTKHGHLPYGLETVFFMMFFFHLGFCLKNYYDPFVRILCERKLMTGSLSLLLIVFLSSFLRVDVGRNVCSNPIFLLVTTISSFLFCNILSELITKSNLKKPMMYIGQNTVCIVLLHFLAFKLVNLGVVLFSGYDFRYIAAFPILCKKIWFAYAIVGITIPLIINEIIKIFFTFLGLNKE